MTVAASFPRALVDSNVLVYAVDGATPAKQQAAYRVVQRLAAEGGGVLSSQCLVEFTSVVTRGKRPLLSLGNASLLVEDFSRALRVYPVQPETVTLACRAAERYPLSFFDALIWAVARTNRVPIILTEDRPGMHEIEGVRYLDPFAPGFDPGSVPV